MAAILEAPLEEVKDEGSSDFAYRLLDPKGKDHLEDAADAQRRLQALIANWLRMENVVCLLGAGCSKSEGIGGLTLQELETAVLTTVAEKWKPNAEVSAFIEERTEQAKSEGAVGFEQWLTILSNAANLVNMNGTPVSAISFKSGDVDLADISKLLDDIEDAIFGHCGLVLPRPDEGPEGHHAFFAKVIARDAALGRVQVFTLNFDTVIEQALDHLRLYYFDGFSGRTAPSFDPAGYGLDIYYPGDVSEGRVRRFDRFLHLYKLHGSINWVVDAEGNVTAIQPSLAELKTQRNIADETKKLAEFGRLRAASDSRLGILPTANKFVQTLEAPFAHLFRLFAQRLQAPQTFLFVCGYGFSDDHVNSMIESGLANASLTMLIVSPEWIDLAVGGTPTSDWLRKHQHVGERIFLLCPSAKDKAFKVATFDDFALNIMPHVKWLDEFVALRQLEKIIQPLPPLNAK